MCEEALVAWSAEFFAGLLLLDSLPEDLTYETWHDDIPLLPRVPRFDFPNTTLETSRVHHEGLSSQQRFTTLWCNLDWTIHADHLDFMPLYICLEMILHEWNSIIWRTEHLLREEHSKMTFRDDAHIDEMVRHGGYARESLDMLQESLNLVQMERKTLSSRGAKPTSMGDDLLSTLESKAQNLITQTQDHIARFDRQLAITASLIAIEESRNSIRLAQNIGYELSCKRITTPLCPADNHIQGPNDTSHHIRPAFLRCFPTWNERLSALIPKHNFHIPLFHHRHSSDCHLPRSGPAMGSCCWNSRVTRTEVATPTVSPMVSHVEIINETRNGLAKQGRVAIKGCPNGDAASLLPLFLRLDLVPLSYCTAEATSKQSSLK